MKTEDTLFRCFCCRISIANVSIVLYHKHKPYALSQVLRLSQRIKALSAGTMDTKSGHDKKSRSMWTSWRHGSDLIGRFILTGFDLISGENNAEMVLYEYCRRRRRDELWGTLMKGSDLWRVFNGASTVLSLTWQKHQLSPQHLVPPPFLCIGDGDYFSHGNIILHYSWFYWYRWRFSCPLLSFFPRTHMDQRITLTTVDREIWFKAFP